MATTPSQAASLDGTRRRRLPALTCLVAIALSVLLPVGGRLRASNGALSAARIDRRATRAARDHVANDVGQHVLAHDHGGRPQGQTVTGTRNVTKDGDTVTVDRNVQSSTGASVSKEKEIEVR